MIVAKNWQSVLLFLRQREITSEVQIEEELELQAHVMPMSQQESETIILETFGSIKCEQI